MRVALALIELMKEIVEELRMGVTIRDLVKGVTLEEIVQQCADAYIKHLKRCNACQGITKRPCIKGKQLYDVWMKAERKLQKREYEELMVEIQAEPRRYKP